MKTLLYFLFGFALAGFVLDRLLVYFWSKGCTGIEGTLAPARSAGVRELEMMRSEISADA